MNYICDRGYSFSLLTWLAFPLIPGNSCFSCWMSGSMNDMVSDELFLDMFSNGVWASEKRFGDRACFPPSARCSLLELREATEGLKMKIFNFSPGFFLLWGQGRRQDRWE